VFERFTEGARQVVVLAQDEAARMQHNYIGTEHLLLGLFREGGLAAEVLRTLDVTETEVRAHVRRIVGEGTEVTTGQIPFTPRTKKALELSLSEALSLGHSYIGTEHLLLGLVHGADGVAGQILTEFGVDEEQVRGGVVRALSEPGYVPHSGESAEVRQVREAKEQAIEAQDFERAARLADEERRLRRGVPPRGPGTSSSGVAIPTRSESQAVRRGRPSIVPALVIAAVGFPLGLFFGWLIWG
jgi:ATP-dependent Clp protease ATP-binding subunit ClpA